MKFNFLENSDSIIKPLNGKKVCYVIESKKSGIVTWAGELSDGLYFLIKVFGGMVMVATDEREMMLVYNLKSIAYEESLFNMYNASGKTLIDSIYIAAQTKIPEVIAAITFEDVMGIFKWKFKSKKVMVSNLDDYETA